MSLPDMLKTARANIGVKENGKRNKKMTTDSHVK
jgi:hypothetical protein